MVNVTESRIQSEIVSWYNNKYCLSFHIPRCLILSIHNGGDRHIATVSQSLATGEYSGAADLLVIHLGKVLFVEVKTPDLKKSVQKPSQKNFQKHIESVGHQYFIVRSIEDFKLLISSYE